MSNWTFHKHPLDGTLNEREFLVCLRKVREREIGHIRKVIEEEQGEAPEGTSVIDLKLASSSLRDMLQALGYQPINEGI